MPKCVFQHINSHTLIKASGRECTSAHVRMNGWHTYHLPKYFQVLIVLLIAYGRYLALVLHHDSQCLLRQEEDICRIGLSSLVLDEVVSVLVLGVV